MVDKPTAEAPGKAPILVDGQRIHARMQWER